MIFIGDNMTKKTYVQMLVETETSQLMQEYTELIGRINHTISEIAIGYVTDNYKLIEMENDVGFDHAFDMADDYVKALRLKGFPIKFNPYIDFQEHLPFHERIGLKL